MKTSISIFLTVIFYKHVYCYLRVCYYTNWSQYRPSGGKFTPDDIDPKLCSHIIYAFGKLEGNVLVPFEWNDDSTDWSTGMYEKVNNLKSTNPNLRTLLAVGGWNAGSVPFSDMVATRATRRQFINSTLHYLRKRNFDGFDMDWEYPARRGGRPEDKANLVLLLSEMKQAFEQESYHTGRPRLLLTAAVPAGKSNIDAGYDIPNVARSLDFINIMTYDLHGSWEPMTGHNSPLFGRSSESAEDAILNMEWAVKYWAQRGTPTHKLVVGIGLYGRSFKLQSPTSNGIGAPAVGAGVAGKYTREPGFMSYYEVCEELQRGATRVWQAEHRAPYLHRGDLWVGYDDEESVISKVRWMKQNKYGGIMVWSLALDDFSGQFCNKGRYPLLTAINKELGAIPDPVSPSAVQSNVVQSSVISASPVAQTTFPTLTNIPFSLSDMSSIQTAEAPLHQSSATPSKPTIPPPPPPVFQSNSGTSAAVQAIGNLLLHGTAKLSPPDSNAHHSLTIPPTGTFNTEPQHAQPSLPPLGISDPGFTNAVPTQSVPSASQVGVEIPALMDLFPVKEPVNLPPSVNTGPSLNLSPPVNTGSSLNLLTPVNSGPSLNFPTPGPNFDFSPPVNTGPNLNLAPPVNTGMSLDLPPSVTNALALGNNLMADGALPPSVMPTEIPNPVLPDISMPIAVPNEFVHGVDHATGGGLQHAGNAIFDPPLANALTQVVPEPAFISEPPLTPDASFSQAAVDTVPAVPVNSVIVQPPGSSINLLSGSPVSISQPADSRPTGKGLLALNGPNVPLVVGALPIVDPTVPGTLSGPIPAVGFPPSPKIDIPIAAAAHSDIGLASVRPAPPSRPSINFSFSSSSSSNSSSSSSSSSSNSSKSSSVNLGSGSAGTSLQPSIQDLLSRGPVDVLPFPADGNLMSVVDKRQGIVPGGTVEAVIPIDNIDSLAQVLANLQTSVPTAGTVLLPEPRNELRPETVLRELDIGNILGSNVAAPVPIARLSPTDPRVRIPGVNIDSIISPRGGTRNVVDNRQIRTRFNPQIIGRRGAPVDRQQRIPPQSPARSRVFTISLAQLRHLVNRLGRNTVRGLLQSGRVVLQPDLQRRQMIRRPVRRTPTPSLRSTLLRQRIQPRISQSTRNILTSRFRRPRRRNIFRSFDNTNLLQTPTQTPRRRGSSSNRDIFSMLGM